MPPILAAPSRAAGPSNSLTPAAQQVGWLLPAGLLLVLLALGRWVQHPDSLSPTVADQAITSRVVLSSPTRLPGAAPAAAL